MTIALIRDAPPRPSAVQSLNLQPLASGEGSEKRSLTTWSLSPKRKFPLRSGMRDRMLSLAKPFSRTRTETSRSSDNREATAQPAVPPRERQTLTNSFNHGQS